MADKRGATVRLVIFGATGGTGRRLVERAVAEGHEVTAFVRNSSRMSARHERLKVVVGDAVDPGRVREAVAGNEAVISVLGSRQPSNPLRPRSLGDPDGPASSGSGNIIAAMKEHGLRRFACQTAWGVGESKHDPGFAGAFFMKVLVPPLLRDEYAAKEAQERIVRESDLEWVIVRPMILTNGPWTNDYRAAEDLKPGRRPYISRADAADFLMRQLTDDTFVRKTPAIGY
jgi:putative NADH-flavin reductase